MLGRSRVSTRTSIIFFSTLIFILLFTSSASATTLGDIDGNGEINVQDVVMVMRHALGLGLLDMNQQINGDVNYDGVININDVVLMMRYSLGLIEQFEKPPEKAPYSWNEDFGLSSIGLSYLMTTDEVIELLGEPLDTRVNEPNGIDFYVNTHLTYNGFVLSFSGDMPVTETTALISYELTIPGIDGPRGIQVGDTALSVIQSYRKENLNSNLGDNYYENINYTYVELYSFVDDEDMENYGRYEYDNHTGHVLNIFYRYGVVASCGVRNITYTIESGMVKSIKEHGVY